MHVHRLLRRAAISSTSASVRGRLGLGKETTKETSAGFLVLVSTATILLRRRRRLTVPVPALRRGCASVSALLIPRARIPALRRRGRRTVPLLLRWRWLTAVALAGLREAAAVRVFVGEAVSTWAGAVPGAGTGGVVGRRRAGGGCVAAWGGRGGRRRRGPERVCP